MVQQGASARLASIEHTILGAILGVTLHLGHVFYSALEWCEG